MEMTKLLGEYTVGELKHWGIKGQKWGRRRFQNKDGTWTKAGKERYGNDDIRDEDNLVEKTIPKGTVMYRTTVNAKDGSGNKSVYVSYKEADRDLYKEGSNIKSYVGGKDNDDVYEHTYELKTDLKIPSLKKIRQIEREAVENSKLLEEVGKSYLKIQRLNEKEFTLVQYDEIEKMASKLKSIKPDDMISRRKIYDEYANKYGDEIADRYYQEAKGMNTVHEMFNKNDYLTIERSLGLATNTKQYIIDRLKKEGYNAMYDNASIGVGSDGKRSANQEGVEPLIVFDGGESLKETSTSKIDKAEQVRAGERYQNWRKQIQQ